MSAMSDGYTIGRHTQAAAIQATMSSAATYHLLALLCTLGVEGAGMALWATFARFPIGRAMLVTFATNLAIHTLFWYSQPLFSAGWPWSLYAAETLVIVLEGAFYARLLPLSGSAPWRLSALLNVASLVAGALLWQILV